MSNQIRLKRGSGSNPTASDLSVGEVALRTDNASLFTKKDDGSVAEIGAAAGVSDGDKGDITVSNSGATFTIDNGVIDNANINASAAIAGTKISPDFGSQQITTTSSLNVGTINASSDSDQILNLNSSDNGGVYLALKRGGSRKAYIGYGGTGDTLSFVNEISDGDINILGSDGGSQINLLNFDVSDNGKATFIGNIVTTGTLGSSDITITGTQPALNFIDNGQNPDYKLYNNNGVLRLHDITNSSDRFVVNSSGEVGIGATNPSTFVEIKSQIPTLTLTDSTSKSWTNSDTTLAQLAFKTADPSGIGAHNVAFIQASNEVNSATTPSAALVFGTSLSNNTASEKMRLDSSGHLLIPNDTGKIKLGASQDLEIFHDGSNSRIHSASHNLNVRTPRFAAFNGAGTEDMLKAIENGAVELYFDNTKKFETYSHGIRTTQNIDIQGSAYLGDQSGSDGIAYFGDSQDLRIYHDGSNSIIEDNGTGGLILGVSGTGTSGFYKGTGQEPLATFEPDGPVSLYFNNSKKLETTTNGLEVTGSIFLGGKIDMGDSSSSTTGRILLGADDDLQIYHSSLNDFIQSSGAGFFIDTNNTLSLRKVTGENKAKFIGDGAVELYFDNDMHLSTSASGCFTNGSFSFRTDGNTEEILYDQANGKLRFNDNKKANFGSSDDLQIYHNGTSSIVANTTGDLYLQDDGTVVIGKVTNAEIGIKVIGDGAVELYHDNVKKLETNVGGILLSDNLRMGDYHIELNDNAQIMLGNAPDFRIFHDGSHSFINDVGTGNLYLRSSQIVFQNATGSEDLAIFTSDGAVKLFNNNTKRFEVVSTGVEITGAVNIPDNSTGLQVGNSQDLKIYHNGANSYIDQTGTGNLIIRGNGSDPVHVRAKPGESSIRLAPDSSVQLYHDNAKKVETRSDGLQVDGTLRLPADNSKLLFGAGLDLEIYHDGSHSRIVDVGTGVLSLQSNDLRIHNVAANEFMARFVENAQVELYYNNSKKFETLSDGVNITGTLKVNGSAFSAGLSTSGGTLTGTLNARTILPTANGTYSLGSSSARWADIFTNDLNLSNEGSANDVDGTWGSYTIQEGEESLFLINKRNGKKYKFLLKEVS